jgi:hypothetical protein
MQSMACISIIYYVRICYGLYLYLAGTIIVLRG